MGNEHNQHRKVGNLYDVKLRAIENLHKHGIDITLVTTIINGVNNDQVGDIIRFAIENIDKVNTVAFQPVSFTGRDEDIDEDTRTKQRYTLSHLAHDVKAQAGIGEVMRDWYPLSASGPFSDLKDLLGGIESDWGSFKCGCHPNCGIGTMLLVDEKTRETVTVPSVLNIDRMLDDIKAITDSARRKTWTALQIGLAILRNLRPEGIPASLSPWKVIQIMDGHTGGKLGFSREEALRLARLLRRRDVVPGPLQLRLPPHRDVHHPVRDADGGDLLLRLQHGRGLAQNHRGDVPDGDPRRVVQEGRPPRGLRPRP